MREIRTSGSEGGGTEPNRFSLPLSELTVAKATAPHVGLPTDRRAAALAVVI